jgi:hypothetical protein
MTCIRFRGNLKSTTEGEWRYSSILNLCARRRWVVYCMPQPSYLQERAPIPTEYQWTGVGGGGGQHISGQLRQDKNLLSLLQFKPQTVQPKAQLIYWLHYPGSNAVISSQTNFTLTPYQFKAQHIFFKTCFYHQLGAQLLYSVIYVLH